MWINTDEPGLERFICSLEQEAESLRTSCSVTDPSAPLKSSPTASEFCNPEWQTDACLGSQYGTTCELLTENRGEDLLTLSPADSHARTSVLLEKGPVLTGSDQDCGEKWTESFARWHQPTCSWRIPLSLFPEGLEGSSVTWPRWGTMRDGECFPAEMQVDTISESARGFLLPTIGKNEFKGASSNRFWNSADYRGAKMAEGVRTSKDDPIYLSPSFSEEAMMWPIMWTASVPLETARFQQWLDSHGASFLEK